MSHSQSCKVFTNHASTNEPDVPSIYHYEPTTQGIYLWANHKRYLPMSQPHKVLTNEPDTQDIYKWAIHASYSSMSQPTNTQGINLLMHLNHRRYLLKLYTKKANHARYLTTMQGIYQWARCAVFITMNQPCKVFTNEPTTQCIYLRANHARYLPVSQPYKVFTNETITQGIYQ